MKKAISIGLIVIMMMALCCSALAGNTANEALQHVVIDSEDKAIARAKEVYSLPEISLGIDADQLSWTAHPGETSEWFVVWASNPEKSVDKMFNITLDGETGSVKDWWFSELMESGETIEISNYVISREEQAEIADKLVSFIQSVSPTDAQKIKQWDLSMIADINVDGTIHHTACYQFYGDEDYIGDIWVDLDDQYRIIQMELTSTALG